jgi:hypothetical protein
LILPKQRSSNVKIITIAFASAIALSAVAPAFAYENELEGAAPASTMRPTDHQRAGVHANAHRAFDARAFAPAPAPVAAPFDFGIANQGT